jgi:hypothetical protein
MHKIARFLTSLIHPGRESASFSRSGFPSLPLLSNFRRVGIMTAFLGAQVLSSVPSQADEFSSLPQSGDLVVGEPVEGGRLVSVFSPASALGARVYQVRENREDRLLFELGGGDSFVVEDLISFYIVWFDEEGVPVYRSPIESIESMSPSLSARQSKSSDLAKPASSSGGFNGLLRSLDVSAFPQITASLELDYNGFPLDGDPANEALLNLSNFGVVENGFVANLESLSTPSAGSSVRRAVDVVFVIDDSGSMDPVASAVSSGASDFAQKLQDENFDFRIALVPYGGGGSYSVPDGTLLDGGVFRTDAAAFQNDIAGMRFDGGTERAFEAISLALNSFAWRPGVQSVIVLVCNEDDDPGAIDDPQIILNELNARNAIFHGVYRQFSGSSDSDFRPLVDGTGGLFFEVNNVSGAGSFDPIADGIVGTVASRYGLTFSAPISDKDGSLRSGQIAVDFISKDGTPVSSNIPFSYTAPNIPPVSVTLTSKTFSDLNKQYEEQVNLPPVQAIVSGGEPGAANSVTLFYRSSGISSYSSVPMVANGQGIYEASIPPSVVLEPAVEFYVRLESIGNVTQNITYPLSDAANNPEAFTVLPNIAPIVTHSPIVSAREGQDISIEAVAEDATTTVTAVRLFYKVASSSIFNELDISGTGSRQDVSGIIPGSFVTTADVEYYIEAEDNFGSKGYYQGADASNPLLIQVSSAGGVPTTVESLTNLRVLADQFAPQGGGIINASGNVHVSTINGDAILRFDSPIEIDLNNQMLRSLSAGKGTVVSVKRDAGSDPEDFALFDGSFEIDGSSVPPVLQVTLGSSLFAPVGGYLLDIPVGPSADTVEIHDELVRVLEVEASVTSPVSKELYIGTIVLDQTGLQTSQQLVAEDPIRTRVSSIYRSPFKISQFKLDMDMVADSVSASSELSMDNVLAGIDSEPALATADPITFDDLSGRLDLPVTSSENLLVPDSKKGQIQNADGGFTLFVDPSSQFNFDNLSTGRDMQLKSGSQGSGLFGEINYRVADGQGATKVVRPAEIANTSLFLKSDGSINAFTDVILFENLNVASSIGQTAPSGDPLYNLVMNQPAGSTSTRGGRGSITASKDVLVEGEVNVSTLFTSPVGDRATLKLAANTSGETSISSRPFPLIVNIPNVPSGSGRDRTAGIKAFLQDFVALPEADRTVEFRLDAKYDADGNLSIARLISAPIGEQSGNIRNPGYVMICDLSQPNMPVLRVGLNGIQNLENLSRAPVVEIVTGVGPTGLAMVVEQPLSIKGKTFYKGSPVKALSSSPQATSVPAGFTLNKGYSWLLVRILSDTSAADFSITLPDGSIVHPGNSAPDYASVAPGQAIYSADTAANDGHFIIGGALAGNYQITINNSGALGNTELEILTQSEVPQINLSSPAIDVLGDTPVSIEWTATDTDSDAVIDLFLDSDNSGFDGVPIALGLSEDADTSYQWTVPDSIQSGAYFIYARIDDRINPPQFVYSGGRVIVTNTQAPSAPQNVNVTPGEGSLLVEWDASPETNIQSYIVSVSSTPGDGDYEFSFGAGQSTSYEVEGLLNNQSYEVAVTAVNTQFLYSPPSASVVEAPNGVGTSGAPDLAFDPASSSVSVNGDQVTVSALVRNVGTQGAFSYRVKAYFGGYGASSLVGSTLFGALAPGATQPVSFVFDSSVYTPVSSAIFVDIEETVKPELNLRNNTSVIATSIAPPLDPPQGLSASKGTKEDIVDVSWIRTLGATGYEVYRNDVDDLATAVLLGNPGRGFLADNSPLPGVEYNYWVLAKNSGRISAATGPEVGFSGTRPEITNVEIQLSGSSVDQQLNATGEPIEFFEELATGLPAGLSLSASGRLTGTVSDSGTFTIKVPVNNIAGFGTPKINLRIPPVAVANLSASQGSYVDRVLVAWDDTNVSTDSLVYEVYRATSNDVSSASLIATVPSLAYSDNSALAGQTYFYWVKAANSGGTSVFSDSASGYLAQLSPAFTGKLFATNGAEFDQFGRSVDLVGSRLLVGAPFFLDADLEFPGAAISFDLDTSTQNGVFFDNNLGNNDFYGWGIAMNEKYIVVGAGGVDDQATDAGRVYVYDALSGLELTRLEAPVPGISEFFGDTLALNGDLLVVGGSGIAYLFDLSAPAQAPVRLDTQIPGSSSVELGRFVSMNDSFIAVSHSDYSDGFSAEVGAVHIFDPAGTYLRTINAPAGLSSGDYFGGPIDLAPSGSRIAIAHEPFLNDVGSVYLFDAATGVLLDTVTPTRSVEDRFGASIRLTDSWLAIGAPDATANAKPYSGQVYLYPIEANGAIGELIEITEPSPTQESYFGYSLDIEGGTLAVGIYGDDAQAVDAGAVALFSLPLASDTSPALTLSAANSSESDGSVLITASLPSPTNQTLTAVFNVENGSAFAGADYVDSTLTFTFGPGASESTASIALVDDNYAEPTESLYLVIDPDLSDEFSYNQPYFEVPIQDDDAFFDLALALLNGNSVGEDLMAMREGFILDNGVDSPNGDQPGALTTGELGAMQGASLGMQLNLDRTLTFEYWAKDNGGDGTYALSVNGVPALVSSFTDDGFNGWTRYTLNLNSGYYVLQWDADAGATSGYQVWIDGFQEISDFQAWIEARGFAAHLTDPDARVTRSSLQNFLAYALGVDPLDSQTKFGDLLPAIIEPTPSQRRIGLRVNTPQQAPSDVVYLIEESEDMVTWEEVARKSGSGNWHGRSRITPTSNTSSMETTEILSPTEISPSSSERFMRLRVVPVVSD